MMNQRFSVENPYTQTHVIPEIYLTKNDLILTSLSEWLACGMRTPIWVGLLGEVCTCQCEYASGKTDLDSSVSMFVERVI